MTLERKIAGVHLQVKKKRMDFFWRFSTPYLNELSQVTTQNMYMYVWSVIELYIPAPKVVMATVNALLLRRGLCVLKVGIYQNSWILL